MDMYRYTCLNAISPKGLNCFDGNYEQTEDISSADAVLVRSANMHEMELGDSVLAVGRAGAGVNNIPLDKCADKGIVVFNTPGANANGVKEIVFAGMLLAARDVVGGVNWVRENAADENIAKTVEKQKKQYAGTEIAGKKLGVIGLGAIGNMVANTAVALGMEVYGYDPFISINWAWNLNREVKHVTDLEKIYRECDYITINVPLLDSTKGMVNEQAIAMMKENAVILNFARDRLVDEEAVLRALDEGRIRRYVCDFPNTTTAGHPGVLLIPHLGASTEESEENCAVMAVGEIRDYLENGNIRNSVNYPACSMGECRSAHRISVAHRTSMNLSSAITDALSSMSCGNLSNTSRGEYSYMLVDIDSDLNEDALKAIEAIDGVIRVRVIK